MTEMDTCPCGAPIEGPATAIGYWCSLGFDCPLVLALWGDDGGS